MQLSNGQRLGPYEILSPIGAGGMGEVWKARDTRLDRIVAIKVSKEEFSERFEREARAVAALNHPHICTLHDIGPSYLVFEYVEGQALKGPLPLDKALGYAAQICDALDAAHIRNIVHRDLKPDNILITKSGVKLLDFGLAKIDTPVAVEQQTITIGLTAKGQILGTLTYMSPEQLQGREADARSDIFSFGCVLYEMLTGKRAFDGSSPASVIAAILERPAPSIADVAPPALDRILKRCLEKDPDHRWQSARDLKAALELLPHASEPGPSAQIPSAGTRRPWLFWAVSALLAVAFGAMAWVHFRQSPPSAEPVRFQILPPANLTVTGAPVVSPDGRSVAFVVRDVNNRSSVFVRPLGSLEAKQVTSFDENNVAFPFWSPDSRSIAYFADGRLKKIDGSGARQVLCDTGGELTGGAWGRKDVIVFGIDSPLPDRSGIWEVPDTGGSPRQITADPAGDVLAFSPAFLPDGEHFLYTVATAAFSGGVYVGSISARAAKRSQQPLLAASSQAMFASPLADQMRGYVLFVRDGVLYGRPFDAARLAFTGDPVAIASPVGAQEMALGHRIGFFSVSSTGVLAFRRGSAAQPQLAWLDRQGKVLGTVGESGDYSEIDLSPDGKRLAAVQSGDIWLTDLDRNVTTRLTLDRANNRSPVWSRDGSRIAFASDRDGPGKIFIARPDGASQQLLYQSDQENTPSDCAPNGRSLVFTTRQKTSFDIWLLPTTTGFQPQPPARPLIHTPFQEGQGRISPDGHWIAYVSRETGTNQVYVRSFPEGDGKWLISGGLGAEPRWRGDGRELYYRSGTSFMAVEIKAGATFQPGEPRKLFDAPIRGAGGFNRNPSYTVTPDGQKFLAVLAPPDNLSDAMTVVLNWQSGLQK